MFSLHENLWPGVSPGPRTATARHVNRHGDVPVRRLAPKRARSAGAGPPVRLPTRGPPATASRWAIEGAPNRFRGSIIDREDGEFLCRKSETGGTPTPPGVEFVR